MSHPFMRKRNASSIKSTARTKWMSEYEAELNRLSPATIGRVDWDVAAYYYLAQWDAKEAAQRAVTNIAN